MLEGGHVRDRPDPTRNGSPGRWDLRAIKRVRFPNRPDMRGGAGRDAPQRLRRVLLVAPSRGRTRGVGSLLLASSPAPKRCSLLAAPVRARADFLSGEWGPGRGPDKRTAPPTRMRRRVPGRP